MDYTWPSIYFSYFFFALSLGLAVYFFVRSWKDGYWGKDSEEAKLRMLEEAGPLPDGRGSECESLSSRERERAVASGRESGKPAVSVAGGSQGANTEA